MCCNQPYAKNQPAATNTPTQLTLEEFRSAPTARPGAVQAPAGDGDASPRPVSWRSGNDRPPPNLGPPPQRLDWRKQQS